jgi:broad specificity phosphatase PhoE
MKLTLVRHAQVTTSPEIPPEQWHLSPEGRAAVERLAAEPVWEAAACIYTSPEPKAVMTAQRVAAPHELTIVIERDLREVDGRAWNATEDHKLRVQRYLSGESIDSWEQRDGAQERIVSCVDRIATKHASEDVVVVSHGLVLTLYLSSLLDLDAAAAFDFWTKIRFPDHAIVDPGAKVLERPFGR